MRALVTGATGFIGRRLAEALQARGIETRCLVRDRERAEGILGRSHELREGDVLDRSTLSGAGQNIDVAYYLVHSMGRGGGGEYADRDRAAAGNFARFAEEEGIGQVIYLGGLGDERVSAHLRSRHETAEILAREGPPLTYFRAAMVVGPESESFRTLRYLVSRLPVMVAPAWLRTPTQPIGVDDVLDYLASAPFVEAARGREIQLGGPDVVTYEEMLDVMADALGVRRRPKLPVPLLSPRISSVWLGLVTPVDTGVARPLIDGLRTDTVVTDPDGAALFEIEPISFRRALARALAEESGGES